MTIDWWTLGIQAVNVLILVWLLGRFFWRPVAGMIEQRRATAQAILAEAESKRTQAAAALADIERTRAGFAGERDAILAAAHETAEQARTILLDEATRAAAAVQAAALDAIEKEKKAADAGWAEHASHLAIDIAEHLAARLDGPLVRGAFLDWLLAEIHALPETARHAVAADGVTLQAISATPLDAADQQRASQRIADAFAAHPHIVFSADAALIAGLELHGPHFVISNSWRADLDKILADLTHDNQR
jgi:F-type H+-transporting ATPase subunit b